MDSIWHWVTYWWSKLWGGDRIVKFGSFSFGIIINDGYPARVKVKDLYFDRRDMRITFIYDVVDINDRKIEVPSSHKGDVEAEIIEAFIEALNHEYGDKPA